MSHDLERKSNVPQCNIYKLWHCILRVMIVRLKTDIPSLPICQKRIFVLCAKFLLL